MSRRIAFFNHNIAQEHQEMDHVDAENDEEPINIFLCKFKFE